MHRTSGGIPEESLPDRQVLPQLLHPQGRVEAHPQLAVLAAERSLVREIPFGAGGRREHCGLLGALPGVSARQAGYSRERVAIGVAVGTGRCGWMCVKGSFLSCSFSFCLRK